jgi:hypothetical protein
VGRPRNRWEDVTHRDAANLLRIRSWKAAARDREEWRKKWGGHGPQTVRSAIEEEDDDDNDEEEEEDYTATQTFRVLSN